MDQALHPSTLTPFQINLEDREIIFEIIHKHWGKLLASYLLLSILFLLSLVMIVYVLFFTNTGDSIPALFAVITFVWFVGLLGYGFSEHYSNQRSVLIITNQRVIDCHQLSLLSRSIQTIDIYEIQSCAGNYDGPLGIFFKYGQLWINTIGDKPFCVAYVPNPESVASTVMRYHNILAHGSPHVAEHQNDEHTLDLAAHGTTLSPTVTLLMFHLPSEKLVEIRDTLPAQKEPTVRYLQKTDYYEVEIMVPTEKVPAIVTRLKEHGAENIVGKVFDLLSSSE